eukprot:CAMPEP_0198246254 /NCGR_PEP_ID=MMETSP1446-20131203/45651_1 /TAXON_ID=1461542 ORGANISM="Unidentified sp, Strain CCMP2111" /NCGR_SAMPLE_ID=MMETSP1446 /ASSEMBLY_ACC=CAM_ASM_001112 /LENGTH=158 /DNA_ID=CAMNT_0043930565 /DNA_START=127 /DNA_END=599 /DNA_ORIENTATION=+
MEQPGPGLHRRKRKDTTRGTRGQEQRQSKQKGKSPSGFPAAGDNGVVTFLGAFALLLAARSVSVAYNLIHDCDETYNYWEPLHYLLYGNGLQTWEYSPKFALRSYLYILVHYVIAKPLLYFTSALSIANPKVFVFFGMRFVLGLASSSTEALLVHAVS